MSYNSKKEIMKYLNLLVDKNISNNPFLYELTEIEKTIKNIA
jgi:disulfide oxidoreductase YuzD